MELTPTPTPEIEWLSKTEAAKRLGIGTRRVLEFAKSGALRSAKQRDVTSGQMAVVISAADVANYKDLRDKPRPAEECGGQTTAVQIAAPRGIAKRSAEVGGSQTSAQAPHPSAPLPLFLNLDQASAVSGLSQRELRSMIRSGELWARRDGREWKVRQSRLLEISDQNCAISTPSDDEA